MGLVENTLALGEFLLSQISAHSTPPTGQGFASWDEIQPPATVTPGNLFSEEWQRWRVTMIMHSVSDETLWIASAGIDRTLVYGHQTPRLDDYNFAGDIQTATAANGASDVTYYGWMPASFGSVDNPMRGVTCYAQATQIYI
jgi:hypothetical protein